MPNEIRDFARQVLQTEAAAVAGLVQMVDESFDRAVQAIVACRGAVLTTGIGKAGHIARKVSATLASTGTPSHFLSPTDAVHGDLGSVRDGDIVLIFSASGESDEIVRLLSIVKKLNHPVIAITSSPTSGLGRHADVALCIGQIEEACPLGLAPSASTTAMLALGDALALTVMKLRSFTAEDFAIFHPAGQLGRKLIRVNDAMTFRGESLAVASDAMTVGQVLAQASRIKRRSGAVVLVDADGRLSGVFTDSDLRRHLTSDDPAMLKSRPIREVMTPNPKRIGADDLASQAMAILRQYRIDELPVVDADNRPVGLIDVQDLVVLRMLDVEPDGR
jgi:arabinose-5-phosphate isomerase